MYIVQESIGNFSSNVYASESFYEVQDYLFDRLDLDKQENPGNYTDEEAGEQLFFSYFHIAEL